MIPFWILTLVMIALALLLVAPTLLRKGKIAASDQNRQNVAIARERMKELESDHAKGVLSQEEFEQAEEELEQLLLLDLETPESAPETETSDFRHGPVTLALLGIALPLMTLLLYLLLGTPQMLEPSASPATGGHDNMPQTVEEMVSRLEERLAQNPEEPDGWYLLGRSYMATSRYPEAVTAFEKLQQLVGDEPEVLLALADAVAMSQGGGLKGRPAELVRKAIELDPNNPTGLWLAGMVAETEGDLDGALRHWRKLEPMLRDEPETQQQLRSMILRAEQQQATGGNNPVK